MQWHRYQQHPGLDGRREHETLGAILDCSRRRQQNVDVERRAEETAYVPEQESSALFCVTVKAGATTTMECKLCDATNTDICD